MLVAMSKRLGCFGSQLPRILLKDAKAVKKDPAIRKWAAVSSRKIYQVNLCQLYLRNSDGTVLPRTHHLHPSGASDGLVRKLVFHYRESFYRDSQAIHHKKEDGDDNPIK